MGRDYSGYRTLLAEKPEPRIGILWLNRPEKRNSISPELSREMNAVLDEIAVDDDIRVLIISGKGSAFCAGMDLKVFYEYRDKGATYENPGEGAGDWFRRLRELPKPTIAAVNGHAYGGGFMVISLCDMAVASEEAQVGLSEINWGSPPGGGATRAALDMLLSKAANYLLYTGNVIDGRAMERYGFVNQTVPHDQLIEASMEIARVVAKHHPIALRFLKRQIHGSISIPEYYLGVEFEHNINAQMRRETGYEGAERGWKEFIDKSYKPGIEALDYPD